MLALMLMPCIISSRQRLGLVGSAGLGLLCCARRLVGLLHLLACNWGTCQRLGLGWLPDSLLIILFFCQACPSLWCCRR